MAFSTGPWIDGELLFGNFIMRTNPSYPIATFPAHVGVFDSLFDGDDGAKLVEVRSGHEADGKLVIKLIQLADGVQPASEIVGIVPVETSVATSP